MNKRIAVAMMIVCAAMIHTKNYMATAIHAARIIKREADCYFDARSAYHKFSERLRHFVLLREQVSDRKNLSDLKFELAIELGAIHHYFLPVFVEACADTQILLKKYPGLISSKERDAQFARYLQLTRSLDVCNRMARNILQK